MSVETTWSPLMPLQNRVTPTGEIIADPARGLFTGNRGGKIHDPASKRLLPKRRWASKAWICCVLRFRGRRREVMGPGYTNLFFLDEVTALAAGHRPCYECRRADANGFAEAWRQAFGLAERPRAGDMDLILHRERTMAATPEPGSDIAALPDGAVIGDAADLWAVRGSRLLSWAPDGYHRWKARPSSGTFPVITPAAVLAVLANKYRPVWHESAGDQC